MKAGSVAKFIAFVVAGILGVAYEEISSLLDLSGTVTFAVGIVLVAVFGAIAAPLALGREDKSRRKTTAASRRV